MLDLQPILTGTHLVLLPLVAQDFDAVFAAGAVGAQRRTGGIRAGTGRLRQCYGGGENRWAEILRSPTSLAGISDCGLRASMTDHPRAPNRSAIGWIVLGLRDFDWMRVMAQSRIAVANAATRPSMRCCVPAEN